MLSRVRVWMQWVQDFFAELTLDDLQLLAVGTGCFALLCWGVSLIAPVLMRLVGMCAAAVFVYTLLQIREREHDAEEDDDGR